MNCYPYVSLIIRPENFVKRIEEIRKFHPCLKPITKIKQELHIEHIGIVPNEWLTEQSFVLVDKKDISEIIDVFQEDNIINAKWSHDTYTSKEMFELKKETMQHSSLKDQRRQLAENCKPISQFRSSLMITMIKLYKPHYILDFCSGWGSRLLAALAYNDHVHYYCGIDPNPDLFDGYKKMINILIPDKNDRKKYNMICDCAESCDIPDSPHKSGLYDMVITSPPYYDSEIYSDNPNQSIIKYKNLEDWYTNFLLKASINAIRKLNENSHFIISINDTKTDSYVNRYIKDISSIIELEYVGVFCVTNDERNLTGMQPIFVWKKLSKNIVMPSKK